MDDQTAIEELTMHVELTSDSAFTPTFRHAIQAIETLQCIRETVESAQRVHERAFWVNGETLLAILGGKP